jgi:hypothetical protein
MPLKQPCPSAAEKPVTDKRVYQEESGFAYFSMAQAFYRTWTETHSLT